MPQGPGRRLVERRAILGPIDHALAGLPGHGRCGGLDIDRLASGECLDLVSSHVGGDRRPHDSN
jgi:hypothetical protein